MRERCLAVKWGIKDMNDQPLPGASRVTVCLQLELMLTCAVLRKRVNWTFLAGGVLQRADGPSVR